MFAGFVAPFVGLFTPVYAALLFSIAVNFCPPGTSQIIITGPEETWTWTKQNDVWVSTNQFGYPSSVTQSFWTIDKRNALAVTYLLKNGEPDTREKVQQRSSKLLPNTIGANRRPSNLGQT
jgi:hypothetical protein